MNAGTIPEMLTIKECSARTGLSDYAIRTMCRRGEIPFITVGTTGKKILINMDGLRDHLNGAWLEKRKEKEGYYDEL